MRNIMRLGVLISACMIEVCASAQTQMDLHVAADEAFKKADATLNSVYKQLMATLNEPQKELLKKSQVAWIKYRDICEKSEGAMYEGGSIQPTVILNCATELTKAKTERLRGMLPDQINKTKTALPTPDAQQTALKNADAEMNKVYKDYMASDPIPSVKDAQVAWLAYRDLCAKAESALYEKDAAQIIQTKCLAELTQDRTKRLKGLFMEGYGEGVSGRP